MLALNTNYSWSPLLEFQVGRLDMPLDQLLLRLIATWSVDAVIRFGPIAFPLGRTILCSKRFGMSFPWFTSRWCCRHDARRNLLGILWW